MASKSVQSGEFRQVNGHLLCLIASGECQANAYYRGPYNGGAAFFVIKDESLPKREVEPLARILSVFPQVISALEIQNHKLAFIGFLAHYGLVGDEEENRVVLKGGGKAVLTATFDRQNRLRKLQGSIAGVP